MINYFYIENIFEGENILTLNGSYGMTNVEYATDPASTWNKVVFTADTNEATVTIPQGGKVYLRGTNQTLSNDSHSDAIISCNRAYNIGGDLTTLLEPNGNVLDLTGRDYAFIYLFCYTYVVDASKLILPSTTLADYCYGYMFIGCGSLTTAPELPATTLAPYCYNGMFIGCYSLHEITALYTDESFNNNHFVFDSEYALTDGTFYKNPNTSIESITGAGIPSSWVIKDYVEPVLTNYFYVENAYASDDANGVTLNGRYGMTNVQFTRTPDVESSWTTIPFSSTQKEYTILFDNQTDKIYFRGTNQTLSNDSNSDAIISCNRAYNIGGDLTTLLEPNGNVLDLTGRDYVFNYLFCYTYVVDASKLILPSTTLAPSCYYSMFSNCGSLTTAPVLPATTLEYGCYSSMFSGCSSLTNAPELPATTLADSCYWGMFSGCGSLTTAPELPATTLAENCYNNMFSNCGSLTTAPELPATTLAPYCYNGMFIGCGSLTTAPELPATTLAPYCYNGMFIGCGSLTTAPVLPATTLADSCYWGMFSGCALTTAPELPATTLAPNCYYYMFSGCALTTAPELPATTLALNCYNEMFSGCSSLTTAPELPATTLAPNCYNSMFMECYSLTTAPVLPATTLVSGCYNRMFSSCYSLHEITALYTDESFNNNNFVFDSEYALTDGTFYKNPNTSIESITGAGIPSSWVIKDYGVEEIVADYFYVENAIEGENQLQIVNNTDNVFNLEYSNDGEKWSQYDFNAQPNMLKIGDRIYLRGNNVSLNNIKINCSNNFNIGGDITTLLETSGNVLDLTVKNNSFAFSRLFENSNLINADKLVLPSLVLSDNCYNGMFMNCQNLISAPIINSNVDNTGSYNDMFNGCNKLNKVIINSLQWDSTKSENWLLNVADVGEIIMTDSIAPVE